MSLCKVKLYTLVDESSNPVLISPLVCRENDSCKDLRAKLESAGCVEWPFEFWDVDEKCRIKRTFEGMNTVGDKVYVIPASEVGDEGLAKRRRTNDGSWREGGESRDGEEVLGFCPPVEEFEVPVYSDAAAEPTTSSLITPSPVLPDGSDSYSASNLKATLVLDDVMEKFKSQVEKLQKELSEMDFDDHLWHLKSYDQNNVGVVKLHCGECKKDFGNSTGDHSKSAIHNLFANFKNSHLQSSLHIRSWCRRKGVDYSNHPQSQACKGKSILLTAADHKRLVEEGLRVLEEVNNSVVGNLGPFVVIGDEDATRLKSFWYKVRCKVDGEIFQLCPARKNLKANLENHIHGLKHSKAVQDISAAERTSSNAIYTGRRGRPSSSTRTIGNQQDLHSWFRASDKYSTGSSKSSECSCPLSLLCWGLRGPSILYGNLNYEYMSLLHDPKPGRLWVPEPATSTEFMYQGVLCTVDGCFRHVKCKRLSITGEPFLNFTCSECNEIHRENDFRMRVLRENHAAVKRGFRDMCPGRRVDYLSIRELAGRSRVLARKYKEEKTSHWLLKAKLAQLKLTSKGLKLSALENFNRKDVLAFCNNIVAAHRTNAFGGKPALWDFLRDVATNLNREKQGFRYSKNTKSFSQAMKIYGGRRMCDLFSLNFAAPSYSSTKRENKKGVQFVAGEHGVIFNSVAQIYREAKRVHGILGPVPVILAEDETKVKSRISWESRSDVLVGFCGAKDNHRCDSHFKPNVGFGEAGYTNIVESFRTNQIGSFARVIMVNPLHDKLPRLVLVVNVTCNCFNSAWVREQWVAIDELWQVHCEEAVGPIIGHASDGDSRRRQLMIKDYTDKVGVRYCLPWVGWSLSGLILSSGRIVGLHDQDYVHNGKKLINPLDSAVKSLQLGADVCLLEHIGQVYNKFTYDDHGLRQEDVQRSDRQNWASAQRLCSLKVRDSLRKLQIERDTHQERTLGTQMYLQIVSDYVDIFLSESLSLRDRVVLAAKVSFFFRLWKLWFKHGDHSVGGNTKTLSVQECFVSNQCYIDIQLSCHFVVLLVKYFRDFHSELSVPLHLTGSDSCEIFFSKVGGMQGMERSYDFHELLGCANTVNHLAAIEYGENGLKFDRVHNKQRNIWAKLHPLGSNQTAANFSDYTGLETDADMILCLQEGFKSAQATLRVLNMAPSTVAREKKWFLEPWALEAADDKHWCYGPPTRPVPGEDGDGEVMRETLAPDSQIPCDLEHSPDVQESEDAISEDGLDNLQVAEDECRHAIRDILNSSELQPETSAVAGERTVRISPVVEYAGKTIYKSTLVSELNGNPFLSKDRLTRIRNSVYFNNAEDYLSASSSSSTCLVGLGTDCGVYFEQDDTRATSSTCRAAQKRNRQGLQRRGSPVLLSAGSDSGSWWIGRVQKIRRSYGTKWGSSRNPIDLMNRSTATGKKVSTSPTVQVMFNWFSKGPGRNKFKYDVTDTQWIDVDCIISSIALTFNSRQNVYCLADSDKQVLDDFVSKQ